MIVRGFDRPNIWLGVEAFQDASTKRDALLDRVVEAEKPGIVYVATRRGAEEVAESLRGRGVEAVAYHGGMKPKEREKIEEAFLEDGAETIVATTAFGMGVDKPDVRFVFHHDISDSVDSYYQEIGRAGRDDGGARAILFYRPQDLGIRRFFAGSGQVEQEQLERVAEAVEERAEGPADPRDLREETNLSESKLTTALSRLEEVDAVEILPTGEVVAGERLRDLDNVTGEAAKVQEHHEEFERSRIEMMRGYAELRDCRREYLLNYFGEDDAAPPGYCDNCQAGVVAERAEEDSPFPLNGPVVHEKWGEGTVQRYEDDKMVVLFDEVGYKTLGLGLVRERGLLKPAD
jgi:ATP-dependent DNA helicase RecQ